MLHWSLAAQQKSLLAQLMIDRSQGRAFNSVIVSEENFLGHAFPLGSKTDLFYPNLAKMLRGLKRTLGSRISRIHLCIRSYDTFLPSYYAMRAMFGERNDFKSIKARWMKVEGGWPSVIERIAEHFPNAQLRVTTFESATPEETFWQIIGSERLRGRLSWNVEVHNQSPTCEAIQAAIQLKKTPNFDPDEVVHQYHVHRHGKRFDPLSPDEKRLLSERYARDLEALRRGGLLASQPLERVA